MGDLSQLNFCQDIDQDNQTTNAPQNELDLAIHWNCLYRQTVLENLILVQQLIENCDNYLFELNSVSLYPRLYRQYDPRIFMNYFSDFSGDICPPNEDVKTKIAVGEVSNFPRTAQCLKFKLMEELRREISVQRKRRIMLQLMREKDEKIDEIRDEPLEKFIPPRFSEEINWNVITGKKKFSHFSSANLKALWNNLHHPAINNCKNSKSEDDKIRDLVTKYGERNWALIAQQLGTGRTPFYCLERYQVLRKRPSRFWSSEEEQLLLGVVEALRLGDKVSFREVSHFLVGRTRRECQNKYNDLKPGRWLGTWSVEEDERLIEAMNVTGLTRYRWVDVSAHVGTRNGQQCRQRWMTTLWRVENLNDEALMHTVSELGTCWEDVGRTLCCPPSVCRNRYRMLMTYSRRLITSAFHRVLHDPVIRSDLKLTDKLEQHVRSLCDVEKKYLMETTILKKRQASLSIARPFDVPDPSIDSSLSQIATQLEEEAEKLARSKKELENEFSESLCQLELRMLPSGTVRPNFLCSRKIFQEVVKKFLSRPLPDLASNEDGIRVMVESLFEELKQSSLRKRRLPSVPKLSSSSLNSPAITAIYHREAIMKHYRRTFSGTKMIGRPRTYFVGLNSDVSAYSQFMQSGPITAAVITRSLNLYDSVRSGLAANRLEEYAVLPSSSDDFRSAIDLIDGKFDDEQTEMFFKAACDIYNCGHVTGAVSLIPPTLSSTRAFVSLLQQRPDIEALSNDEPVADDQLFLEFSAMFIVLFTWPAVLTTCPLTQREPIKLNVKRKRSKVNTGTKRGNIYRFWSREKKEEFSKKMSRAARLRTVWRKSPPKEDDAPPKRRSARLAAKREKMEKS